MINFVNYDVELTLTKEMLGTNPLNPLTLDKFIIERQKKLIAKQNSVEDHDNPYYKAKQISADRQEKELAALEENKDNTSLGLDDKGVTCFFRHEDKPAIGSHMILGFLKAANSALSKTAYYRRGVVMRDDAFTNSIINQHCSVPTEFIIPDKDIVRDNSGMPFYLQRPILCSTPKGARTSLARSEQIPAGAKLNFTLQVLKNSPLTTEHLETLFSYGEMKGLGQWRNAGYGTFSFYLQQQFNRQ